MIKVENRADEHLIVRSLEVINDIKGGGIDTIKTNVDALQRGISSLSERQKKYWQDMGSDSVITPLEKKTLLKEFNTIEQTHTSIMQVANEKEITWKEDVADYDTAYTLLRNYLYDTLKVFDYMGENTTVPNIDTFNGHYEFYYLKEPLAQKEISAASSEVTANMRRLANLDEPGSDGEVAIYNGSIYNYYIAKQAWIKLSNGEYLGPGEHHPIHKNVGDYYLNVAPYTDLALAVNRKVLLINGGKSLAFRKETGGIIFEYNGLFWDPVQDRNNWRYTVAQNDLLSYGYGLSPNLDGKIEDKIEREIEKIPPSHVPCYLGVLTEWPNQDGTYKDPETSEALKYYEKDWFTWKGASTTDRKLGHVYIFNAPEWTEVDPSKSIYNEQIMSALDDITGLLAAGDGYFNTIYARKLFALEAVINELSAQVIELRGENAMIKSQGFTEGSNVKGFILKSDGTFECYSGRFNGNIDSGPLKLDVTSSGERILDFNTNTLVSEIVFNNEFNLFFDNVIYNLQDSRYNDQPIKTIKIQRQETIESYAGESWCSYSVNMRYYYDYKIATHNYKITMITFDIIMTGENGEELSYANSYYNKEFVGTTEVFYGQQSSSPGVQPEPPLNEHEEDRPFRNQLYVKSIVGENSLVLQGLPDILTSNMPEGTVYMDNGFLKIKQS